jgi:hypothetical protein
MTETTILFSELQGCLMRDGYYGFKSDDSETVIKETRYGIGAVTTVKNDIPANLEITLNTLFDSRAHDESFSKIKCQYDQLPCKGNKHQLLIYLWIELGLPGYREGQRIGCKFWKRDALEYWQNDFEIMKTELMEFLREKKYPLPSYFFPDEPDNTTNKLQNTEKEYDRSVYNLTVLLPRLEEELKETSNINPESMADLREKKRAIDKIKNEIASIRNGSAAGLKESPVERKQRLHAWFYEEKRLKGEYGALQRTAKREGISRQFLSEILKRET